MKSILQTDKECYFSTRTDNLHKHHVFGGARRKLSEQYGLWVWLTAELHNMSDRGVHFNKDLDLLLKRMAQVKAMNYYSWTVEEFIRIFGRSYI